MSSLNIPIKEENYELSTLYWIPKFQKNQYLNRYILTLFLVVFEYVYDAYLFEMKHVCKLNWTKRPSEVLSFSVRRLLSIAFHLVPYARGPPGNRPACPCVKTALNTHLFYIPPMLMLKIYRPRWTQRDDHTLHDPLGLVMVKRCVFSAVLTHGHTGQLPGDPRA
jgi:hypothetical protein